MVVKIWEARIKAGITIQELSTRTGISVGALNNYENGKRIPNLLQVENIAKALNTTMTELFDSEFK